MQDGTVLVAAAAALLTAGMLAACASPGSSRDISREAEIARGGRLYDKWYAEAGAQAPDSRHPLYPESGAYADKGASTWRCKECHGWDYLGADGAYASGKHHTGIPGIKGSVGGDVDAIQEVLTQAPHGYGDHMSAADLRALALFVSRGQVDMDNVIDRASKSAHGNADRGGAHFATLCAGCHGDDGRMEEMPALGPLARKNPWETLHKVLNGQPDCAMPALRTLDRRVALDIVTFTQTLPGDE
jgi:thiosulfate dehydrogenase